VTPNLKAALKRIRLKDKKRSMWVDLICINQQDTPERSQQVALMADIFRNAKKVIMWIREETDDTAAASTTITTFSEVRNILSSDPG
jgi:hypothetical protein